VAIRTKLEDGSGAMGNMPDITLQNGKLTEQVALAISSKIQEIIRRVNQGWSLGSGATGYKAGNLDAQYVDVVFPSVADTQVAIPHGLQRRPIGYAVVRSDRAADIYDSSAGSWTVEVLYLKSNVANATVRLLVW
jgi:hypothetical protein